MRTHLLHWTVPVLGLILAGCSKGPTPPQPGTPAFRWLGAQTTYKAGDVLRTGENLQELIKTDNEFAARALPWAVVISAGVTQGYLDLADAYDAGAKANRQNPMPFNREASTLRSLAGASALEFAQTVHMFQEKNKDPNVLLAFEYPAAGSVNPPPSAERIRTGIFLQDSERESLQRAMVQRGVLMALCRAVGSADDVAKTQETMKAPEVRVPREAFQFALARSLNDASIVFGSTKLDRPDRLKVMLMEAQEALKNVPENKDSKTLKTKLEAALKKIKA